MEEEYVCSVLLVTLMWDGHWIYTVLVWIGDFRFWGSCIKVRDRENDVQNYTTSLKHQQKYTA